MASFNGYHVLDIFSLPPTMYVANRFSCNCIQKISCLLLLIVISTYDLFKQKSMASFLSSFHLCSTTTVAYLQHPQQSMFVTLTSNLVILSPTISAISVASTNQKTLSLIVTFTSDLDPNINQYLFPYFYHFSR